MLFLCEVVWVEEAANWPPSWNESRGFSEDESDDFEKDDVDVDSLGLETGVDIRYRSCEVSGVVLHILENLCDDLRCENQHTRIEQYTATELTAPKAARPKPMTKARNVKGL